VTGYFARLAARTGIGAEGSPATHDLPPPLVTEDIVTFVTPERSARAPDMPSSSGEQRITPALPPVTPPVPTPSARFALPDAFEQTPGDTAIRSAEAPAPSAETSVQSAETTRSRRGTPTTLPPADQSQPAATMEVETRVEQSAIALPAARDPGTPSQVVPPSRPAPLFQLAAPVTLEEIEVEADPEHPARAGDLVGQGRLPPASAPEFRVARQGREEEVSARHAWPTRPAKSHAHARPQSAPSVRIGSIQVDVHAPPPPPPPTPPRRASSLRRFYLRDW
jgi:hypothetical protein